jgi:Holliday junction resolvasome RuvABC DNA-binding subunit
MREWIVNLEKYISYDEKIKYITTIPSIGKKKAETILIYFGYSIEK